MDSEDIRKEVDAEREMPAPADKADRDPHKGSFKPLSNRELPVQMKAAPLQSAGIFGTGSGKEIPVPPSPIVKIMAPPAIERPHRDPKPLDKFQTARPAFVPPPQPQPPYAQGFKPDVSIRVGLKPAPVDERKMDSGPLPDRHPRSGGFTGPMGGQQVALRSPSTKTGEKCAVQVQSPIKPPPPLIAHGHLGPIPVKGFEKVKDEVETRQEPLPPPPPMSCAVASSRPTPAPSQMRPQPPAFEEPKPGISIERMVFLERVERIMASEARIKEIEAENKTLVGMVARLNKELDELKAKLAARS